MKIKYLHNDVIRHVENNIGREMIVAGLAKEVVAAVPELLPVEMTWQARDGAKVEDFQYPPGIYAKCWRCGNTSWVESAKGTAHISMQFRHKAGCPSVAIAGTPEPLPANIAQEYLERWERYSKLFRNKKVVLPGLTKNNSVPGSGTKVQVVSTTFVAPKG